MKLFLHRPRFDLDLIEIENPTLCSFGITETIAAVITAVSAASAAGSAAIAGGLTELGVGAATAGILGTTAIGALEGGALGALTNPKNPLKGAEIGALSAGALSGGGALISNLAAPAAGAGASAGAAAAPAGAAAGADVTSNFISGTSATGQALGGAAGGAGGTTALGAATGGNLLATQTGAGATGATTGATGAAGGGFMSGTSPTGQALSSTAGMGAGTSAAGSGFMSGTSSTGQSLASAQTPGTVGVGAATGNPSFAQSVLDAPSSNLASGGTTGGADSASLVDGSASIGGVSSPTSLTNFLNDPSFGSGFDVIKANPGMALNSLAFGADMLMGQRKPEGYDQLKASAAFDTAQGNQLQSYLRSGTLPPGLEAGQRAASEASKAAIRQQYANAGLSGSSAEQQDLQNVNVQIAAQSAQVAERLMQAGIQESQMGEQLYQELMKINMEQDAQLGQAIGNFAAAFAGMGSPVHAGA